MVATPRLLAGAATGRLLRRPWLALPAAVLTHFVLDAIPHAGYGFLLTPGRPLTPQPLAPPAAELALGVALLVCVAWRATDRWLVVASAPAAEVPDALFRMPL